MAAVSVEVVNIERLGRALSPGIIDGPMRDLLGKSAREGLRSAHAAAPRDTGALRRSLSAETHPLQARVYTRRPAAYFPVMEFGRRPGAKMPPPQQLRGWARRHGFPTSPGALFVLARAIARRGIRGRFFMRAGAQSVRQRLPEWLRTMGESIGVNFERAR